MAASRSRSQSKPSSDFLEYDPGRLMLAVRNNNVTMARQLLENLPDPGLLNMTDDWGYTPLHIAAEENKTDICRLLLAANANIRIKDAFGNTAMHHAASGGSLDVAELLVSRKAPLDVRNDAGNTALHLAASRGHIGIVETLVVAGGDASLRNSEQKTALILAEEKRQTHVVHYLRGVEREQIHSVYDEIKARERELVESYERAVVEARHRVFRSRVFTICPPQSTDEFSLHETLVLPSDSAREARQAHQTIHIDPVTYTITANQATPWEASTNSPKPQLEVYSKAVAQYVMREMLNRSPILKANVSQQDLKRKAAAERRERLANKQGQKTQAVGSVIEEVTEESQDESHSCSQSQSRSQSQSQGQSRSVEEAEVAGFDVIETQSSHDVIETQASGDGDEMPTPRARRQSVTHSLPLCPKDVPADVQKFIIEMWREVKKTGSTEVVNEPGVGGKLPQLSLSVWEVKMNTRSALWRVVWPIFFTYKAFYAAAYDLSQAWNQEDERQPGCKSRRGIAGRNLDVFLRNLCSVVAQVPPYHFTWFGANHKAEHVAPPFTIVGMHEESGVSGDVVVRANLEQVQMRVMDSTVAPHVPDQGEFVFSIPGDRTAELLRRYIDQTLRKENFCGEAISVNWLLFEHCIDPLKASKKKALPYSRLVQQIGVKAVKAPHISIDRMLQYYHDIGYLFHFSNSPILQSVVFLCPQWLIDLLDAVLSLTAMPPVTHESENEDEVTENQAIVKLRETGHVEESLLMEVSDQFGVEDALEISLRDLLEGFDLLVQMPNGNGGFDCYIPLLASIYTEPSISLPLTIIEGCVKCYDTHCPFALFYYLADVYLLRRFCQSNKFRLSKDCVSMRLRDNVQLILNEYIDHISVILVHMGDEVGASKEQGRNVVKTDEDLRLLCMEVNTAIEEGVAMVKSRWIPGLLATLETPLQH